MIYETIGNNIKHFRKERGMTQCELADLLFVSPQMISRYESNSSAPDVAMLAKICSIFHISMDILCGLDSTSRDKLIIYLSQKYSEKTYASFSSLSEKYENFIVEASDVMNDDRVMKIQLWLLENLHDNIDNEKHHQEINEKIFACASRILDISHDDDLRSYANYRMALYYWETPFEYEEYQNNLKLSKEHLQKVLMCTYFPEYTPLIGIDVRNEDYIKSQIDNIDFFANKLYNAIRQLRRKDTEVVSTAKYNNLLCCLGNYLTDE